MNSSVRTHRSIRRYQWFVALLVVALLGTLYGWGVRAQIKGAVIAPGQIVVESHSKRVQHRDGGIVSKVFVEEGARVIAGMELLRLDDTDTRAELSIIEAVFDEAIASESRLRAQIGGNGELLVPQQLADRMGEPSVVEIIEGQKRLLRSQITTMDGRKKQLAQQIQQLQKEIDGVQAQHDSVVRQSRLIGKELSDVKSLEEQKLVRISRVLALEREKARLDGLAGQYVATIARARGRIGETRLKILQVDEEARRAALTDLRETQTRIAQLNERKTAANAKLKRTSVYSPRTGYVLQLNVHTIGGVIKPGETLMLIVPENDDLVIKAKLRPEDVTQVYESQQALVRLPAFDQRKTPQIIGEIEHVGADLMQTDKNESAYYDTRVRLASDELAKLGDEPLKPGMPVEVFIQTSERTPLNYLIKPLLDQMAHAFRER